MESKKAEKATSEKIILLSKILGILLLIGSFIAGFAVMISMSNGKQELPTILIGVAIIVSGMLTALTAYLVLKGFGELLANSEKTARYATLSYKKLAEMTKQSK